MSLSPNDISRLYRLEARRMAGFFMRRTHDPEAAVDLVAETFAIVVRDRRRFRGAGDDAALAWVYGIARNLLLRWYRSGVIERRAMRRLGIERPEITPPEVERLAELADLAEARAVIAEQLRLLPDDQRVAVQFRVIDELPYEEVARRMDVSPAVARARVSRGLRAMADTLARHPEFADGAVPRG